MAEKIPFSVVISSDCIGPICADGPIEFVGASLRARENARDRATPRDGRAKTRDTARNRAKPRDTKNSPRDDRAMTARSTKRR